MKKSELVKLIKEIVEEKDTPKDLVGRIVKNNNAFK